jgi:hypothetical protein
VPILVLKAGMIRQTDRICHNDEAAFIKECFKKCAYLAQIVKFSPKNLIYKGNQMFYHPQPKPETANCG